MAEQKKTAAQLWQEAQDAQRRWQQVQQQAPGAYQSGYGAQIDALLAQLETAMRCTSSISSSTHVRARPRWRTRWVLQRG